MAFSRYQYALMRIRLMSYLPHPVDNAVGIIWGPQDISTEALDGIDGQSNTQIIVETLDGNNFNQVYAAKLCSDLVAFGCDDWYLPSRLELNAMHKFLRENNQAFSEEPGAYWSSTELGVHQAYSQNFNVPSNLGNNHPKYDQLNNCRCVRRMPE